MYLVELAVLKLRKERMLESGFPSLLPVLSSLEASTATAWSRQRRLYQLCDGADLLGTYEQAGAQWPLYAAIS